MKCNKKLNIEELTEWILGNDGAQGFQGLWFSLLVDGLNPELVLVSRGEASDLHLRVLGAPDRQPHSCVRVKLLHQVPFYRLASIILGLLPLQLAPVFVYVGHFQWTFGLPWLSWKRNIIFSWSCLWLCLKNFYLKRTRVPSWNIGGFVV